MLILGEKEIEANAVGVRVRKDGDIGAMPIDKFIEKIKNEVEIGKAPAKCSVIIPINLSKDPNNAL